MKMCKKSICVLLAAMLVLGFAFAEGDGATLEFSGSVQTGAQATFDSDDGNAIGLYSDEYDEAGVGVAVTLAGSYDAKKYGAEFEITLENKTPILTYGYAWANFGKDIFKVKAGYIDDDEWVTKGDIEADFADVMGVQLQIMPVKGLNFGFVAELDEYFVSADDFADYVAFAAAYTNDSFSAQGAYKLSGEAYAGFELTAIENLTFIAEGLFENITDGDLLATISETIGYDFTDAFNAELLCYQKIKSAEGADPEFSFEPTLAYAFNDNFSASLGGGFTLCGDETSFYVKPCVQYDIVKEDVFVKLFYKYDTADGEPDNTIQLDFVWNY